MKRIPLAIILLGAAAHAEMADVLKPDIQRKELAVRRFIESFGDTTIPYKITTQKYTTSVGRSSWTSRLVKMDEYVFTFPKDVQGKLDMLDKQVLHDTLMDYFDDERHSFTVAVLMAAETTGYRPSIEFRPWTPEVKAFLKKDKLLWNKEFLQTPLEGDKFLFIRQGFLNDCYHSLDAKSGYSSKLRALCETHHCTLSYRYSVLRESIPSTYTNKVFAVENDPVFKAYANAPVEKILDLSPAFRYTGARQDEFSPFVTPIQWAENRTADTQRFLKICRENDPAVNPHLSALVMAMFTVDGYAFNDGTGVYTMNERGRMLMDFIVEFPIPENATRIQAVMNGGNKDEIEALMERHNTEEKWQQLLKNPSHPEFANDPQD
jgi:hypothetical protein